MMKLRADYPACTRLSAAQLGQYSARKHRYRNRSGVADVSMTEEFVVKRANLNLSGMALETDA